MQLLSLQDFAAAAGQGFELAMGEASLNVSLVKVEPLPAAPFNGQMRQPFALLFKAASPVVLPQKTYSLKNATMGRLDVFLVPVGREPDGVVYQAVFN
jgi:hypothetical protein